MKQASDAHARETSGQEIVYAGTAEPTDDEIAKIPTDLNREGYIYYYRSNAHPNSTFKYTMCLMIGLPILLFINFSF